MKYSAVRLGRKIVLTALVTLSLAVVGSVLGCGLDWTLPTNHFDGVDPQGYVAYWEKIGEVDCGDGLSLPLHINFNSKRDAGAPSPYLGQGWLLPLLESKFVQESEDRFVMIQPDGLSNLFLRRAGPEGTVLDGSAGWKGEIKGETITAWASCGWKLVFANGRIVSMTTPKGRKLDWVYEGGRVSELREGGTTKLRVEYDAQGKVMALALADGRRILLMQDKKPRVQSAGGQNIIAGVDSSLSYVITDDGAKRHYTFGVSDQILPNLLVETRRDVITSPANEARSGKLKAPASSRLFVWNAHSKLIVRDGIWIYQVEPAKKIDNYAAIARSNSQQTKEYWYNDEDAGVETVLCSDGHTKKVFRLINGRIRKVEDIYNGISNLVYRASYDESGRIIRENKEAIEILYKYTKDGLPESAIEGGSTLWTRSYSASGNLTKITTFFGGEAFTTIIPQS